jgi:CBS domain-containing protein
LPPVEHSRGNSRKIITVREDLGVFEAIQEMRRHGVRRMPVLDQEGTLAGIISIDDLFALLAEEMAELAKLISKEQVEETRRKPADWIVCRLRSKRR